jgi:hypothetical protein
VVALSRYARAHQTGEEAVISLTPAQLLSLTKPRLCIWCEREPALIGEGSNYCSECRSALHPKLYPRGRNLK